MNQIKKVSLDLINPPSNPIRKKIETKGIEELANSLKTVGQLQPILIKKAGKQYQIEAGHRRWLAAMQAKWTEISAIIIGEASAEDMHIERAHENLIRENLNPIEEAQLVHTLVYEKERGTEGAAKLLSKSKSWIETRLDVLDFPENIKTAIAEKKINIAQGRELSKCKDTEYRDKLLERIIETGATAATIKNWVYDPGTKSYVDHIDQNTIMGQTQAAYMGPVHMQCNFCESRHPMQNLRHTWLCPACLSGMHEAKKQNEEE